MLITSGSGCSRVVAGYTFNDPLRSLRGDNRGLVDSYKAVPKQPWGVTVLDQIVTQLGIYYRSAQSCHRQLINDSCNFRNKTLGVLADADDNGEPAAWKDLGVTLVCSIAFERARIKYDLGQSCANFRLPRRRYWDEAYSSFFPGVAASGRSSRCH